jgi:hypothetical protein
VADSAHPDGALPQLPNLIDDRQNERWATKRPLPHLETEGVAGVPFLLTSAKTWATERIAPKLQPVPHQNQAQSSERSQLPVTMTTQAILEKLMEVERALQNRDCLAAHILVFDVQDRVLQLEREMIEMQVRKVRLPDDVPAALASNWSWRANGLESAADEAHYGTEGPLQVLTHAQAY